MHLQTSDNHLVCTACGAQYDAILPSSSSPSTFNSESDAAAATTDSIFIPVSSPSCALKSCRICDDPRQFVPPQGQTFTNLGMMRASKKYKNVFKPWDRDEKVIEVWTKPKFGIGQRACIIQTSCGNIMWDMVAYLDQDTVQKIEELGGLKLIVISHPHFYTTWYDWSVTFGCPVYMASVDAKAWANRLSDATVSSAPASPSTEEGVDVAANLQKARLELLSDTYTELIPGVTAIIAGGHFPGSMMLHTSAPHNTSVPSLFVADTIFAVPSGHNPTVPERDSGIVSYSFMWSIPNMIPLHPDAVAQIWEAIKDERFEFRATYGVMAGSSNVFAKPDEKGLKWRLLESMKIFLHRSGWTEHKLLTETL